MRLSRVRRIKDVGLVVRFRKVDYAAPHDTQVREGQRVPVLVGERAGSVVILGETWTSVLLTRVEGLKAAGRWNLPRGPILPRR